MSVSNFPKSLCASSIFLSNIFKKSFFFVLIMFTWWDAYLACWNFTLFSVLLTYYCCMFFTLNYKSLFSECNYVVLSGFITECSPRRLKMYVTNVTVFGGDWSTAQMIPYDVLKDEQRAFNDWLIDWIVFYAVSVIFQPCNGGSL